MDLLNGLQMVVSYYGIFILAIFFVMAIFVLKKQYDEMHPIVKVIVISGNTIQFSTRRLFNNMVVSGNAIIQHYIFKKPVIGISINEFTELKLIRKFLFGYKIEPHIIALKEKDELLPLYFYKIDEKDYIGLGLKIAIAKDIMSKFANEMEKTIEFTQKENPVLAFVMSYGFSVAVLFTMGLIIVAIFLNFNSAVGTVVEQLKEITLRLAELKNCG